MPKTTSIKGWGAREQRAGPGPRFGSSRGRAEQQRRRRGTLLLLAVALAILIGAVLALTGGTSAASILASGFTKAWERHDYGAMYADIDAEARAHTSLQRFEQYFRAAATTATATALHSGAHAHEAGGGEVTVPARVQTRIFGTLHLEWHLPLRSEGEAQRIAWTPSLSFPGIPAGGRLTRRTSLPQRASILAADGSALAEGTPPPGSSEGQRASALGAYGEAVVGNVGPVPSADRSALEAQGVPANAIVGTSGMELAYDARLRGSPGGELLAGSHVIARAQAKAAPSLRTSIVPGLQKSAVNALGGQLGGVVAIRPGSGEVLAVAGLGINDTQPPGSTFKMVTLTSILNAGIANPHTVFPYATSTTLEGTKLDNAGGESCGGTLRLAFAVSCNSVFIPLGVKLGAKRLVQTAEAFGFNQRPELPGAVESSIPKAADFQGEVELGSSAIGQGRVLASPLQMALVAATIAGGGGRPQLTFLANAPHHTVAHVMSNQVAQSVKQLMLAVVQEGIGGSAAIPGVEVAGKTGTSELGSNPCGAAPEGQPTPSSESAEGASESCASKERHNTDAWFAAFAPANKPRIAVGVLMVKDGYGGETAAPVAKQVIEAALSEG